MEVSALYFTCYYYNVLQLILQFQIYGNILFFFSFQVYSHVGINILLLCNIRCVLYILKGIPVLSLSVVIVISFTSIANILLLFKRNSCFVIVRCDCDIFHIDCNFFIKLPKTPCKILYKNSLWQICTNNVYIDVIYCDQLKKCATVKNKDRKY